MLVDSFQTLTGHTLEFLILIFTFQQLQYVYRCKDFFRENDIDL